MKSTDTFAKNTPILLTLSIHSCIIVNYYCHCLKSLVQLLIDSSSRTHFLNILIAIAEKKSNFFIVKLPCFPYCEGFLRNHQ